MAEPVDLSPANCEELLEAAVVGRIAFKTPTGPEIVPVNYAVIDKAILIRTSPYSVLGTYGRGALAAFEIDQFDHEYQHGWSVVAHGRLEHLSDPVDLDRVQSTWKPRPWAGGASRHLYLRLPWSKLTGRRLGSGWDLMGELETHRRAPAARVAP
jgi:hypothetical protein